MIWAISVFLVTTRCLEWSREALFSTAAGLAAIVVAVFPTGRPGDGFALTPLQEWLGEGRVETIHFVAAAVFIVALGWISSYFARYRDRNQRLHWTAVGAIGLAAGLALLAAFDRTAGQGDPDRGVGRDLGVRRVVARDGRVDLVLRRD